MRNTWSRSLLVAVLVSMVGGVADAKDVAKPHASPRLAPPTPEAIQAALAKAHKEFKGLKEGKNADYIPALAEVDPSLFGIAIATVDGRIYQVGAVEHPFSIQSIGKVFTAAKAMEALGPDAIEKKIGVDATGQKFNSIMAIEMNEEHRAGNPLVNPGAIAMVSLVPAKTAVERWNAILGTMSGAAGRPLTVDQKVYKSETETNQRNQAISRLLQAYEVLGADPAETLDLYTRECSVAINAHDLAMMGATLANGGTNPLTGQHVVSPTVASKVLAVMATNGLYEDSGTWAFRVGVPAKSGVGGGILAVVPGRYAIATFSPPLDEAGNSVRGQKAIEAIVADLGGNLFDTGTPATPRAARRAPPKD